MVDCRDQTENNNNNGSLLVLFGTNLVYKAMVNINQSRTAFRLSAGAASTLTYKWQLQYYVITLVSLFITI